ncbi:hypothetical protein PG997_013686 [Apiospora hydei]|uniref:Uncharacterized protein n=1 Tax=Apiospora hydei TaxID=1337664 RepID=A0ABR1V6W4_9PEZI
MARSRTRQVPSAVTATAAPKPASQAASVLSNNNQNSETLIAAASAFRDYNLSRSSPTSAVAGNNWQQSQHGPYQSPGSSQQQYSSGLPLRPSVVTPRPLSPKKGTVETTVESLNPSTPLQPATRWAPRKCDLPEAL